MKVVIAADHAGYSHKEALLKIIRQEGYEVRDLGVFNEDPVDYPDQAAIVAATILANEAERGIIVCGSGVGVCVAANKFKNIRAGVCHDVYSAHQCVEHDDVNVLCLGQRVIGIELACEIVLHFLAAKFSHAPRHEKRLNKIKAIEEKNMKP